MKKKPCKSCKEKEEYPLYIQASNPTPSLLKWIKKMSKKGIVYFQSGKPPGGCGGAGNPC